MVTSMLDADLEKCVKEKREFTQQHSRKHDPPSSTSGVLPDSATHQGGSIIPDHITTYL